MPLKAYASDVNIQISLTSSSSYFFIFLNQTAFSYGVLSYLNLESGVKEDQQVDQIKGTLWAEVQIFI